jgi:uncharacterized protein (TIGR02145 family)
VKNNHLEVSLIILMSFLLLLTHSCKKDPVTPAIETGTLTDIDGNVYQTITIGTQTWMAENLKTTKFNNGDSIPSVSIDTTWAALNTGAFCNFKPDSVSVAIYGRLYNYFAVIDQRKLCPLGWHIPSDDEWKELEIFLGMSKEDVAKLNWRGNDQGNKMKIAGGNTSYWAKSSDMYEIYGTNESGFRGIGGACRVFNGQWGEITHTGFWWTSSLAGNEAWYRGLDYNKTNVFRYYGPKNYGFSVRCIKD